MKGLCEVIYENLGGLSSAIEGKYNKKELEKVEQELRNIFQHPDDS